MLDFILDFPIKYPRFSYFILGLVIGYAMK